MSNTSQSGCTRKCWTGAAVVGALVFLALLVGGYGFFPALVLGVIAFALLGFMLVWMVCADSPKATPAGVSSTAAAAGTSAAASPAAAAVAPTPPAEPAPEPEPVSEQAALAEQTETPDTATEDTQTEDVPAESAPAEEEPASQAPVRSDMATAPDADKAEDVPLIKPSTPLAGQAELASRKGTWKYERS